MAKSRKWFLHDGGTGYNPCSTDPSPEEIEEGCKYIRSHWSEHEKIRRFVGPHPDKDRLRGTTPLTVLVPRCDIDGYLQPNRVSDILLQSSGGGDV